MYMKVLTKVFVFFTGALLTVTACKNTESIQEEIPVNNTTEGSPLRVLMETSDVFADNFTGFMLYDPEGDTSLYQQNSDKYFTPASNTKLFTFYAALKFLPDSLPALDYIIRGDSLIFWGTGDPTFLHPDFEDSVVFNFLKESSLDLYYSDNQYEDDYLGPGWAWGDYQYYYSTEKTPLPIYGNVAEVKIQEINQLKISQTETGFDIKPKYFSTKVDTAADRPGKETPFLYREFNDNTIKYSPKSDTVEYTSYRPFHYTPELIASLLSDTLGKEVSYVDRIKPRQVNTLYDVKKDTVLTRMLQPSDNFIAEQLLLNIAAEQDYPMNSRAVINEVSATAFSSFQKEPVWRDGSGLSRYNLFTPENMVALLNLIDDQFEDDSDMFRHFPAGGKSGTISSWYAHREYGEPYVFAKTGTLSNNHCLSGFIVTEKGNKLLFSFMNNHYVSSSSVVKTEMEKVLWHIYENY